jgi:hypothetical protein
MFELVLCERDKSNRPTGKMITVKTDNPEKLWNELYRYTPPKYKNRIMDSFYANDKIKKDKQ